MEDFYLYALSTWTRFWPLVTAGSLLGVEEFASRYDLPINRYKRFVNGNSRRLLQTFALVFAMFISGFLAWDDEHKKVASLNGHDTLKHVTFEEAIEFRQAVKLDEALKKFQVFVSHSYDNNSYLYAADLVKMFKSADLKADLVMAAGQGKNEKGVIFYLKDEQNPSLAFQQMIKALDSAKIIYSVIPSSDDPFLSKEQDFTIFVTREKTPDN